MTVPEPAEGPCRPSLTQRRVPCLLAVHAPTRGCTRVCVQRRETRVGTGPLPYDLALPLRFALSPNTSGDRDCGEAGSPRGALTDPRGMPPGGCVLPPCLQNPWRPPDCPWAAAGPLSCGGLHSGHPGPQLEAPTAPERNPKLPQGEQGSGGSRRPCPPAPRTAGPARCRPALRQQPALGPQLQLLVPTCSTSRRPREHRPASPVTSAPGRFRRPHTGRTWGLPRPAARGWAVGHLPVRTSLRGSRHGLSADRPGTSRPGSGSCSHDLLQGCGGGHHRGPVQRRFSGTQTAQGSWE